MISGFLALFLTGCQVDLRPTVRLLRDTLITVRIDYARGKVDLSEHALEARMERIGEAVRLGQAALEGE